MGDGDSAPAAAAAGSGADGPLLRHRWVAIDLGQRDGGLRGPVPECCVEFVSGVMSGDPAAYEDPVEEKCPNCGRPFSVCAVDTRGSEVLIATASARTERGAQG